VRKKKKGQRRNGSGIGVEEIRGETPWPHGTVGLVVVKFEG